MGRPALFLDRDGTLIEDPGYLSNPAGVRLLPGAAGALWRFRKAGFTLVLVTNQSGIGRGYFDWRAYEAVAETVRAALANEGLDFDAEVVCGHAPGGDCGWRKPAAGMILAAAAALQSNLVGSVMAGDKLSDLESGAAAGVGRLVHVATGAGPSERPIVERSQLTIERVADLGSVPCAS